MFKFSSKTQVDKQFKMTELYKTIKADKVVKADANCIKKVVLSNVISTVTMNMTSDDNCREIYIFRIYLKEKRVPLEFIRCLDKVIFLHTYFILQYGEQVKELCIYRQVHDDTVRYGRVYEKEWQSENLKDLPFCSSIKDIYKSLMLEFIETKPRDNESLEELIERDSAIKKLEREISIMQKKADSEKQPRKKFDLAREIRNCKLQMAND